VEDVNIMSFGIHSDDVCELFANVIAFAFKCREPFADGFESVVGSLDQSSANDWIVGRRQRSDVINKSGDGIDPSSDTSINDDVSSDSEFDDGRDVWRAPYDRVRLRCGSRESIENISEFARVIGTDPL